MNISFLLEISYNFLKACLDSPVYFSLIYLTVIHLLSTCWSILLKMVALLNNKGV